MNSAVLDIKTGDENKSLKIAFLTREDLNLQYRDLPNSEITAYSFNRRILSMEDINRCDEIIFRDNWEFIRLKTKYSDIAQG